MSEENGVVKKIVQIGTTLSGGKVTCYHLLYGYAKLMLMDESVLNVMLSVQSKKELDEARQLFEAAHLNLNAIKKWMPVYVAGFSTEKEIEVCKQIIDAYADQSAAALAEKILAMDAMDLSVFEHGTEEEKILEHLHEVQKGEGERTLAQREYKKESETKATSVSGQSGVDNVAKFSEVSQRYKELSGNLLKDIKGQDEAVMEFVQGCFQGEVFSGLDARPRPMATFLFVGPPGVGKTLLAESAATYMKRPMKVFNMSEYTTNIATMDLIGVSEKYGRGSEGKLVKFVRECPDGILIFDEIEKAHPDVIQLFLQILDRGLLTNEYKEREEKFDRNIIIFTSNVGRALYDDGTKGNYARMPKNVILDAIRREENPRTGAPAFPDAICSRFAAGNVIMFNHLAVRHLVQIVEDKFEKVLNGVNQKFGYQVVVDDTLPMLSLYHYGGIVDARIAASQSDKFLEKEFFELSRQIGNQRDLMDETEVLHLEVDIDHMSTDIRKLFINDSVNKILVLCDEQEKAYFNLDEAQYTCYFASTLDEMKHFMKQDVDVVLVDLYFGEKPGYIHGISLDDFHSMGIDCFNELMETGCRVPVMVLDIDNKLTEVDKSSFYQLGAAGTLPLDTKVPQAFVREIEEKCEEIYMEKQSQDFARRGYVLDYNTSQVLSEDKKTVSISYTEFKKHSSIGIDGRKSVLSDTDRPTTRFAEVIGAENAKSELKYFVDFLKNPKSFVLNGGKPPKGVLLYGPPGTGKTMLARAMAGESDVAFLQTSATEFMNPYVGQSEANIRNLFATAKRYAPAIIFIDEIDAIGKERTGSSTTSHTESMLNALLTEMDGFKVDAEHPVFVLAATNYDLDGSISGKQRSLDPALIRRFDNRIYVDLPNEAERKYFLQSQLNRKNVVGIADDVLQNIAARTTGQSLAILQSILDLAIRTARKKNEPLTGKHLIDAMEEFNYGEEHKWEQSYYESVAIHEAGHTYVAWVSGEKPSFVTIVSRGDFGGYMQHENQEQTPRYTRENLLWRIRTALAGRAAEEVFYGKEASLNTGAGSDLKHATQVAMNMISVYGMQPDSLVTLSPDALLQTAMAKEFIDETNELLKAQMVETVAIVKKGKEKIQKLAAELVAKNQLTGEEIERILGE